MVNELLYKSCTGILHFIRTDLWFFHPVSGIQSFKNSLIADGGVRSTTWIYIHKENLFLWGINDFMQLATSVNVLLVRVSLHLGLFVMST